MVQNELWQVTTKKLKPWKLNKNPNLCIEYAHNILNKEIAIFRFFFGKP